MPMSNMYGGMPPSNNSMWIGNNYAAVPRNNYSPMNSQSNMVNPSFANQPQSINNILQVMGPDSAQSFLVGPNSKAILMDSGRPVFYLKQSDDTGYAETKAFAFHEIPLFDPAPQIQAKEISTGQEIKNQDYVTKSDFEDFKKMIEDLVMKNE